MYSVVFAHDGTCFFSGDWLTLTSARSLDSQLFFPPHGVTHKVRYTNGATAGLQIGEVLTGGTSAATAILLGQVIDNNVSAGSADKGWLLLGSISGKFEAETLTGGTSTGTVDIYEAPQPFTAMGLPRTLLITVETADIRFSLDGGLAGTTALSGHGSLMSDKDSYVIRGSENIRKFSAINAVNANGAVIKYHLFY